MPMTIERIRELAEKYLNEQGKQGVEQFLDDRKLEDAKLYLLGGLDYYWFNGFVSDEVAASFYVELGIDPDIASQFRQNHVLRC